MLIVVASPSPSETAGECLRDFLEGPKKRSVIRLGNYVDVSSVPFSTLTVYPPPLQEIRCAVALTHVTFAVSSFVLGHLSH